MSTSKSELFLPHLIEPVPGKWWVQECDIRESAVELTHRQARVPKAHTEAQRLARLHELGHVKYSPRNWQEVLASVMAIAAGSGTLLRPEVAGKISKMLEENRIDWLMWRRHQRDIRMAREVLDWKLMKPPPDPYRALGQVLQLAWTVWGSKGLSKVTNAPPPRDLAPDVEEYFDACWSIVEEYNDEILPAMVRGCLQMYADPTHATRDRITAELAAYFPPVPVEEPEDEMPPPKEEEKKAQEEEEEKEKEREKKKEEEESGAGGEPSYEGTYEIHDHTARIKRQSMRIARKERPVYAGIKFTFAHRYILDKAIFAQRILTEGGIMIDGSGSMNWTDEDMEAVISKMPAVWIGKYFGIINKSRMMAGKLEQINGRICVLAKNGRFAQHVGKKEFDNTGANEVDLEALRLLATWPKPRLWLSDGLVCGGKFDRVDARYPPGSWMRVHGKLVEECNRVMRQNEILRVPTVDVMHKLLKRQRVTLFATCVSKKLESFSVNYWEQRHVDAAWPDPIREWPVSYCL